MENVFVTSVDLWNTLLDLRSALCSIYRPNPSLGNLDKYS
jgi:hypothetical protein